MAVPGFYALHTGLAPRDDQQVPVHVRELGTVLVHSNMIEACDPFTQLGSGARFTAPDGRHRVAVTIADVSGSGDGSHLREAYLSVLFSSAESTSVTEAQPLNNSHPTFYGIPVDAGTVAFVDGGAAQSFTPPDGDWERLFEDGPESWFALMDSETHYFEGAANISLPGATHGENLVLTHSGWGDGIYPVAETRAADGSLTGLHIDLGIVGS